MIAELFSLVQDLDGDQWRLWVSDTGLKFKLCLCITRIMADVWRRLVLFFGGQL